LRRLSILLAEADAASRRVNTKLLESAGHQVTPASRAQEAVDKFATDLFDLVLLDAEMKDLNTVKPCQQLRDFEAELAHTPVYMFLPAEVLPNPEADGYVRKPLDVDELMAIINRVAAPEVA
jgi:CheY-like chemotaxis protein